MNRVWKRALILLLCVALVVGDNAILGFAAEVYDVIEEESFITDIEELGEEDTSEKNKEANEDELVQMDETVDDTESAEQEEVIEEVIEEESLLEASDVNNIDILSAEDLLILAQSINSGETQCENTVINILNDIDLTNADWVPLGDSEEHAFKGSINGNGNKLIGLSDDSYCTGLIGFWEVDSETYIKDINLVDIDLSGINFGGIACSVNVTSAGKLNVNNINIQGKIQNRKLGISGGFFSIVNVADKASVVIDKCTVKCDIKQGGGALNQAVSGGFIGMVNGAGQLEVNTSVVSGIVETRNNYGAENAIAGGIIGVCGISDVLMSEVYCTGSVTAISNGAEAGGFIGEVALANLTRLIIENSCMYASIKNDVIDISHPVRVGGVIGHAFGEGGNKITIRNSFLGGKLDDGGNSAYRYRAAFVGWQDDDLCPNIVNSYFDQVSYQTSQMVGKWRDVYGMTWLDSNISNSRGLSQSEIGDVSNYNEWDFENVWEIKDGYPILKGLKNYDSNTEAEEIITPTYWKGSGKDTTESVLKVDFNRKDINKWFLEKREPYNHGLTKASLAVAMAAFDKDYSDKELTEEELLEDIYNGRRPDHIKKMFKYIGMEEDTFSIEYPIPNEDDSIGTAIARKNINDDTTLILVAIRGSGYETEWGNNFVVGTGVEHAGFNMAANTTLHRLNYYIRENKDDLKSNVKVWICGYSRAGATANLVSARLIDKQYDYGRYYSYIDDLALEKEDIYGFCFECPRNTRNTKSNDSEYEYIVNIINPVDFVTKVAMNNNLGWKYNRYGTDYCLPSESATKNYDYWFDRIIEPYQKNSGQAMTPTGLGIEEFSITQIFSNIAAITNNPMTYTESYQELFKKLGSNWLGTGNNQLNLFDWINAVSDVISIAKGIKNPTLIFSAVCEAIMFTQYDVPFSAYHYPELCYTWLYEIDEREWDKAIRTDYHTDYVLLDIVNVIIDNITITNLYSVNNELDNDAEYFEIEVRDSNEILVSKMVNGEVILNEGILMLNEDNQKIIIGTPGDESYTVSVRANNQVKFNCSFKDVDSATNNIKRATSYSDISINADDEVNLFIKNDENEENSSFEIKNEKNEVIDPINDQIASEIEFFVVDAILNGDGIVQGCGVFTKGESVTLIAKPDEGSRFKEWIISGKVVSTDLTYSFIAEKDIEIEAVFETYKDLWVSSIQEQTYTGTAVKPDIKVYHNKTLLKQGIDYTIAYQRNIASYEYDEENENFDSAKAPTIIVTGKGNFAGKETVTFKIKKADISTGTFTADSMVLKVAARTQTPKPVLKWNGKVVAATNYTLQYFKADAEGNPIEEALANVKDAGKYVIVITGKGNFTGTRNVPLTLTDSTQKLVSSLSVAAIKPQTYTGTAIEPTVTVKSGKTELIKSEDGVTGDYTVTYRNNTAVGTATVVITGINSYVGTKTVTFKINGTPITKVTVEGITAVMPYTGNDITFDEAKVYIKATKTTEEIKLTKDTDYKISYLNNQKAGVATVVFTGINGYTGVLKKNFRITPAKQVEMADRFKVDFTDASVTIDGIVYSKGGAKPAVTVKFVNGDGTERVLTEKTDYVLAYTKNTAVNDCGNDKNLPTVKVTFRGSYNGVITKNFKITAKDISTVTATAADKTYVKKAGAYKSAIKLTDTDGKVLLANRDYVSAVEYSVVRNGQKVVLGPKDIVEVDEPNGTLVKVTVTAKDGGNYTGTTSTTYRVTKAPITSAKVAKVKSKIYTGKAITLAPEDITIKPSALADPLVYGTDYEIVDGTYAKNINKGTASVMIRGIGNYGGTRKVTFTIKAKGFVWWWRK